MTISSVVLSLLTESQLLLSFSFCCVAFVAAAAAAAGWLANLAADTNLLIIGNWTVEPDNVKIWA